MSLVLQLAIRNLWRQRRRNGLILLAVVLTIGGVFIMNALARGMEHGFLEDSIRMLRGHVRIEAFQYEDEPGAKNLISTDNLDAVTGNTSIVAISPRLRIPAVIMSERETRGVSLVGYDPDRETHSFIADIEVSGQPIQSSSDSFIVIGGELAEELETEIGRRLVVIFEGSDENTVETGVQVLGIFDAGSKSTESAYALIGLSALQNLLNTDQISDISLHLKNEEEAAQFASDLGTQMPNVSVRSWLELDPFVGQIYQFMSFTIYILIGVFMLTLVFGLVNALVTAVLERAREFGLLRAVGLNSRMVVIQVVIECVIIMMLGLALGVGIGLLFYLWLQDGIDLSNFASGIEAFGMSSKMIPILLLEDFLTIAIASLLLGLIASYFPARRVVKTSILDSLHN